MPLALHLTLRPGFWAEWMCQAAGLHWAGACGRECPRSCRESGALYQRGPSPLVGCSRTDGGPRRTGTGWLRCKEMSPPPLRNSALQAWTQATSAAAPTSS